MAWKPWYERLADLETAEERDNFLRGVFGPPPVKGKQLAGMAMTAIMVGWGVNNLKKAATK